MCLAPALPSSGRDEDQSPTFSKASLSHAENMAIASQAPCFIKSHCHLLPCDLGYLLSLAVPQFPPLYKAE